MNTQKRIEELETLLAEARRVGLSAIARAEKWRTALSTISTRASDTTIRDFANTALLDI
jgi:hypothetical protein